MEEGEDDADGDDVDATAENREDDDAKEEDAQDNMVVRATTRGPRTLWRLAFCGTSSHTELR